jgi:transcriptional regulator with XRE-family HTH domain
VADDLDDEEIKRLEALIAEDAEQLRKLLAKVMRIVGVTQRDVEQRLRLGSGYISNVLTGRVELKHAHIKAILLVCGIEPSAFYAMHYPKEIPFAPGLTSDDFIRRLERLGGVPPARPPEPEPEAEALPRTPEELREFVIGILKAAGYAPPEPTRKDSAAGARKPRGKRPRGAARRGTRKKRNTPPPGRR